ncbi:hypothetical protein AAY473_040405 [Plecturocebus cupreus]
MNSGAQGSPASEAKNPGDQGLRVSKICRALAAKELPVSLPEPHSVTQVTALISQTPVILPHQPPKQLGLQMCTTMPN